MLFATCAVGRAAPALPASQLTLFSGTVAQSLTHAPTGPANLVTTYYQAEGAWPLASWLGVEAEVEGGQIIGNNHAESLAISAGSVYKLNELEEEPELAVPNLFFTGKLDDGAWRWRLGRGSTKFARVRGLVAGGLAWEGVAGRKKDFAGVGLSRGVSIATDREEVMAEAVYRWQAKSWLAFSPDVQWVHHPARSHAAGAWLFGLRCAITHTQ